MFRALKTNFNMQVCNAKMVNLQETDQPDQQGENYSDSIKNIRDDKNKVKGCNKLLKLLMLLRNKTKQVCLKRLMDYFFNLRRGIG